MDFTTVKANLEKNGFKVSVFETKEEAAEYLDKKIDGKTIGFGGSVTLQEMGMKDKLCAHNTLYSHWDVPDGMSADEVRTLAMSTDVYLLSANGMAETGEILNIDGTGNRIASSIFGHKEVYFVVGRNKIAKDYDGALWHARNVASPMNAKRLKKNTPCAVDGKCHNCSSPDRICKALTVIWQPTRGVDMEVVLINEDLGY